MTFADTVLDGVKTARLDPQSPLAVEWEARRQAMTPAQRAEADLRASNFKKLKSAIQGGRARSPIYRDAVSARQGRIDAAGARVQDLINRALVHADPAEQARLRAEGERELLNARNNAANLNRVQRRVAVAGQPAGAPLSKDFIDATRKLPTYADGQHRVLQHQLGKLPRGAPPAAAGGLVGKLPWGKMALGGGAAALGLYGLNKLLSPARPPEMERPIYG